MLIVGEPSDCTATRQSAAVQSNGGLQTQRTELQGTWQWKPGTEQSVCVQTAFVHAQKRIVWKAIEGSRLGRPKERAQRRQQAGDVFISWDLLFVPSLLAHL